MEVRRLQEAALLEQARRLDAQAYEELVRRYQDIAFRVAYLNLGDRAEAEEAAQDGFVKAYYAMSRFRDGASFRPWLLRIVANEARNRRKAMRRRLRLAEEAGIELNLRDQPVAPEEAAEAHEERRALVAAVSRLRDEDRMVVGCRYFLDLSEKETAEVLGWPQGTVKSRTSRALGRLREALPGDLDG